MSKKTTPPAAPASAAPRPPTDAEIEAKADELQAAADAKVRDGFRVAARNLLNTRHREALAVIRDEEEIERAAAHREEISAAAGMVPRWVYGDTTGRAISHFERGASTIERGCYISPFPDHERDLLLLHPEHADRLVGLVGKARRMFFDELQALEEGIFFERFKGATNELQRKGFWIGRVERAREIFEAYPRSAPPDREIEAKQSVMDGPVLVRRRDSAPPDVRLV